MLEINVNSTEQPQYYVFTPLKDLKEFTFFQEFNHEN